ncbi:hypothetical protein Dimus_039507 [Dionaea muscipula]
MGLQREPIPVGPFTLSQTVWCLDEFQLMILYVPCVVGMPKLLQRVVHLYGATANKVRDEVLGDASSGTPSELQDINIPQVERTDDVATSSAAPEMRASSPPPEVAPAPTEDVAPIRPGSPLGRIRRERQQSASPQAAEESEGEKKSTDSSALVQKKRKRAVDTAGTAGGNEEEIIDTTIGREHEQPDDASSHPVQGDDEIQEVAPPQETVEVAEPVVEVTETVASTKTEEEEIEERWEGSGGDG